MSESLFNYGPLPNADLIAKVIEHTRAINQAYLDAIDAQKSKAVELKADQSRTAHASEDVHGSSATDHSKGKGIVA